MIYITIPAGMVFKRVKVSESSADSKTEIEKIKDSFVDPDNKKKRIDIQDLVKSALQYNKGRKTSIELKEGITLYLRRAPNSQDKFLAYSPNNNGALPTLTEPQVVAGREAQKYNPALYSKYGTFWDRFTQLSNERQAEVDEARNAQKLDRQHVGDSPKPT